MLGSIASGLDKADALPIGATNFDLGAYFRHVSGVSTAGLHAEVTSRLNKNISAFGMASLGMRRDEFTTSLEALGMVGLRGRF